MFGAHQPARRGTSAALHPELLLAVAPGISMTPCRADLHMPLDGVPDRVSCRGPAHGHQGARHGLKGGSDMNGTGVVVRVACALAGAAALGGCSSANNTTTPTSQPAPTTSSVPIPRGATPLPFNVAGAVAGTPDPTSTAFLTDQNNLYDPAEFGNPLLYPPGYHWKIDRGVGPHGIQAVAVVQDRQSHQWAITLRFTPAAAARWAADTQAAYQQPQGTPFNRMAIFVGSQIVWAPQVITPGGADVEITANWSTQAQAVQVAAAIKAAAGL
jgi:hypothetical protein